MLRCLFPPSEIPHLLEPSLEDCGGLMNVSIPSLFLLSVGNSVLEYVFAFLNQQTHSHRSILWKPSHNSGQKKKLSQIPLDVSLRGSVFELNRRSVPRCLLHRLWFDSDTQWWINTRVFLTHHLSSQYLVSLCFFFLGGVLKGSAFTRGWYNSRVTFFFAQGTECSFQLDSFNYSSAYFGVLEWNVGMWVEVNVGVNLAALGLWGELKWGRSLVGTDFEL